MKERFKGLIENVRPLATGCAAMIARMRESRLICYGALALFLGMLALASSAYRTRAARTEPDEAPAPMSVIAIRQPESEASEQTPDEARQPRWVWPLEGEVIGEYSPDAPIWSQTLSQWQTHPALDIAGIEGEAVCACADGTVSDAWKDRLWGNVIAIEHADGYVSTYAGVNTLKLVAPGDAVVAGEVISAVGPSAICEADQSAHLHFELTHDGQSVDPRTLIGASDGESDGESDAP